MKSHLTVRTTYLIVCCAVMLTGALGSRPRAAGPADLFFSEYIEGSGNNKALEIYNGTSASIDLAASGYNVQMFFNGSSSAALTINLTGTVATGDVFVLAHSSAVAEILAQADQVNGASWFNGDDTVVLRKGSAVIDVIGQAGSDPGTQWGNGPVSTADNTLRRKSGVCGGDTNAGDAFAPSDEWDGFAPDTFDGLGTHVSGCDVVDSAPSVSGVTPLDGTSDVTFDASLSVTFSEPVSLTSPWFTLTCTLSGAHAATVSGGPSAFSINPDADFVRGDSCAFTVLAASVHDQDVSDPPDVMQADVTTSFATLSVDPCTLPFTGTFAIQGAGLSAAITGVVTTQGVVVGDYEVPPTGSGQIRGFFIQDTEGDGDPATSDGLFVFRGGAGNVSLGDVVRVTGTAGDFQGQTQISGVTSVLSCGRGSVTPVDVTLPVPSATALERFEGMLVRLPQTLTVTEHFQLGRFGQVVVSSGGRLDQPTDVLPPGAEAAALQAANELNRLIIDDGTNVEDPDPIEFGRSGNALSATNTLRGGDTATGTVGVMTYTWAGNSASGNAYRVRPSGALDGFVRFEPANRRPRSAPPKNKALRIASMNLLNFFTTFSGCRAGISGGPIECRGAENQTEFDRQWPKTVAAMVGTKADVIGILEIENNGYGADSALGFLVDRLNEATAPGRYAFIDVDAATGTPDALGSDAIKVAIVYRTDRVIPIGRTAALNTAAFVTGGDSVPRNRPALAQAFEQFADGARFVISVNHLKSKGSACDAPDAGDGQGNCTQVRRNAAALLAQWLASDPTGAGDPDVLVVGDLNSYSMEQPVTDLTAAGYINLLPEFGGGHSYAFDGQWGSLDHALASATLRPQVVAARDWFINADEPSALDYNTDFKSAAQLQSLYAADWFRMSDHNPLLVDLNLGEERKARNVGRVPLDPPTIRSRSVR